MLLPFEGKPVHVSPCLRSPSLYVLHTVGSKRSTKPPQARKRLDYLKCRRQQWEAVYEYVTKTDAAATLATIEEAYAKVFVDRVCDRVCAATDLLIGQGQAGFWLSSEVCMATEDIDVGHRTPMMLHQIGASLEFLS